MALRKYIGVVRTNKVGSECEFEFEIDDKNLPTDPTARKEAIENIARDALYESGMFEWSYNEEAE
jgi:hypothetical protein